MTKSPAAFLPETRSAIPWDALLLVYATLAIPLVFSLLVGVNVWAWSRARINYSFIFGERRNPLNGTCAEAAVAEFDVRNQLDSREYFEVSVLVSSEAMDEHI